MRPQIISFKQLIFSDSAAWRNLFSAFRPTTHVTWRMGTSQWPIYKPWKGKRPWMRSRGPTITMGSKNHWTILPKKSAQILQPLAEGIQPRSMVKSALVTDVPSEFQVAIPPAAIHLSDGQPGHPAPGHVPFPLPQEIARPYEKPLGFPFSNQKNPRDPREYRVRR